MKGYLLQVARELLRELDGGQGLAGSIAHSLYIPPPGAESEVIVLRVACQDLLTDAAGLFDSGD